MADERFDGMLLGMAQQSQGIQPLLDNVFGFLRRKTDFFTGASRGEIDKLVQDCLDKQHRLAKADADKEAAKREKADLDARRRAAAAMQPKKDKPAEPAPLPPRATVEEVTEEEAAAFASRNQAISDKAKRELEEAKKAQLKKPGDKDDEEEDEKDKNKLKPNHLNGGTTDTYLWGQTLSEVEVRIPVPPGTPAKLVAVEIKVGHLKAGLKGQAPIIDSALHAKVKPEDCFWSVEDGQVISITLSKLNNMEWWSRIVPAEPEINTRKIVPENSKLSDLDGETQATVSKMMFDQRQKQMGQPTSDELKKQEMLQKFMAAHPEMDFSNAKFQ
jgi:hypothetical protein